MRYTGPRTRKGEYFSMILFRSLNKLFAGISSAWKIDGFETFNSLATAARVLRTEIRDAFASFARSASVTIFGTARHLNLFSHFDYTFSLRKPQHFSMNKWYEG
jgi:hypothetical protein